MIVKCFGCTTIHNKALYKCTIHSFKIHLTQNTVILWNVILIEYSCFFALIFVTVNILSVCSCPLCSVHGRSALWGGLVHYREGMSSWREPLWHRDLVYFFCSRGKTVWTHTLPKHATFTSTTWYEHFLLLLSVVNNAVITTQHLYTTQFSVGQHGEFMWLSQTLGLLWFFEITLITNDTLRLSNVTKNTIFFYVT